MRYLILGVTEARDEHGEVLPVGGTRLRTLLAALALRAGRPAPVVALIDDVWTDDSPQDAPAALQALVGRLRRVLGREAVVGHPGRLPAHRRARRHRPARLRTARPPGRAAEMTAYMRRAYMPHVPARFEAAVANTRAHGGGWEYAITWMFRPHMLVDTPFGTTGMDEDLAELRVLGRRIGDRYLRAQVASATAETGMMRGRYEEEGALGLGLTPDDVLGLLTGVAEELSGS